MRYRRKNSGDQEARRYRAAIAKAKNGSEARVSIPKETSIRGSLLWDEIKDEIEPKAFVTLVFFAKLIIAVIKDERSAQHSVINKEIGEYRFVDVKDEIGRTLPSP